MGAWRGDKWHQTATGTGVYMDMTVPLLSLHYLLNPILQMESNPEFVSDQAKEKGEAEDLRCKYFVAIQEL